MSRAPPPPPRSFPQGSAPTEPSAGGGVDPVTGNYVAPERVFARDGEHVFESEQTQMYYFRALEQGLVVEMVEGKPRFVKAKMERIWSLMTSEGNFAKITSRSQIPESALNTLLKEGKYQFTASAPELKDSYFAMTKRREIHGSLDVRGSKGQPIVPQRQFILTAEEAHFVLEFQVPPEQEPAIVQTEFKSPSLLNSLKVEAFIERAIVPLNNSREETARARRQSNAILRPDEFLVELEKDAKGYGFVLTWDPTRGAMAVKTINPNGVAERSKVIREGDAIRAVQGVRVDGMEARQVQQLLRNVPIRALLVMQHAPAGWEGFKAQTKGPAPAPPKRNLNDASTGASGPPPPRPPRASNANAGPPPPRPPRQSAEAPPPLPRPSTASSSTSSAPRPAPSPAINQPALPIAARPRPAPPAPVVQEPANAPSPARRRPAPPPVPLPVVAGTVAAASVAARPAPEPSRQPAPAPPARHSSTPPPPVQRPQPVPSTTAVPAHQRAAAPPPPVERIAAPPPPVERIAAPPPPVQRMPSERQQEAMAPPSPAPMPSSPTKPTSMPAPLQRESSSSSQQPPPRNETPLAASEFGPEYAKYVKMKRAGLPDGAIVNAMNRDGVSVPAGFFPDDFKAPKPVEIKVVATKSSHNDEVAPARGGGGSLVDALNNFDASKLHKRSMEESASPSPRPTSVNPLLAELEKKAQGGLRRRTQEEIDAEAEERAKAELAKKGQNLFNEALLDKFKNANPKDEDDDDENNEWSDFEM